MLDRGCGTIICAASGPSLSDEQVDIATQALQDGRCGIVVVNRTYEHFQNANALYAADGKFLRLHIDAIRERFTGEVWTQDHKAAEDLGLNWIHGKPGAGLCAEPDTIYHGGNSGHQAVGLAKLFGARRILLIGYDMAPLNGRQHWHADHVRPLSNGDMRVLVVHFEKMARDLERAGVECVNCTGLNSAIPYFRRGDLAAEPGMVTA